MLSHKIGNNDLYHFGWNLWNHFRANRIDKRQECAVEWLKAVFANLENVEASTLWRWAKMGYLVPVGYGGQKRYRAADVHAITEGKK